QTFFHRFVREWLADALPGPGDPGAGEHRGTTGVPPLMLRINLLHAQGGAGHTRFKPGPPSTPRCRGGTLFLARPADSLSNTRTRTSDPFDAAIHVPYGARYRRCPPSTPFRARSRGFLSIGQSLPLHRHTRPQPHQGASESSLCGTWTQLLGTPPTP